MQKVTLRFPNHDSLWLFKDRSNAINVMIAPKLNAITGLFSTLEVETAVKELQAIQTEHTSATTQTPSIKHIITKPSWLSARWKLFGLFSLLNL